MQGKSMRGRGPSAVVRVYDSLLQNTKDLTEIASQLGGAAGEYLLDECSAKVNHRIYLFISDYISFQSCFW